MRDGSLLVRYEGGHVQGIEHGTGWRDGPAIWIWAGAFSQVGICPRPTTPTMTPAGHAVSLPRPAGEFFGGAR